MTAPVEVAYCAGCGYRLDRVLLELGQRFHPGCDPASDCGSPGGLELAHDPKGWALPAGHIDAVAGRHWLWRRTHVWPCHWTRYTSVCQRLAVWRAVQTPSSRVLWRNYWCDTHLPHARPAEPGDVAFTDAVALLTAVLDATPVPGEPTAVCYEEAHRRVRRGRGRAADHACVDCGGQPARDWSYDHADPDELVDERGRRYSLDPRYYEPRCGPCHARFDRDHRGTR